MQDRLRIDFNKKYAVSIAGLVDINKITKTEYVASIAGLVDINRVAKTEYVVSIAGLVDINRMADNKTHWGDSIANFDRYKLFLDANWPLDREN